MAKTLDSQARQSKVVSRKKKPTNEGMITVTVSTPTAPETSPTDPTDQDATVTAPESDGEDTEHDVPEIDTDAMLESVKEQDLTVYGVLSIAANARKTFQEIAKQLTAIAKGGDNFDSLMTKHSEDPKIAEINKARVALLNKLNEVQAMGQSRLAELGVTTTAITDQEKACLLYTSPSPRD